MAPYPRLGSPPPGPKELEAATFLRRLVAAALDAGLVLTMSFAVGYRLVLRSEFVPPRVLPVMDHLAGVMVSHWQDLFKIGLLVAGMALVYDVAFHTLLGRTPGEAATGIGVVGPDGERPGPVRVVMRTLAAIPTMGLLGLGLWWAAAQRERRALYDVLTGCHLVRR